LGELNILFSNNENSKRLLELVGGIKRFLICNQCQLPSMQLQRDSSGLNKFVYRCNTITCRKKKAIYCGMGMNIPKIEIKKIVQCAYYYSLNLANYEVCFLTGIAENTYIALKKVFFIEFKARFKWQ
jgi:hypothetical protein